MRQPSLLASRFRANGNQPEREVNLSVNGDLFPIIWGILPNSEVGRLAEVPMELKHPAARGRTYEAPTSWHEGLRRTSLGSPRF